MTPHYRSSPTPPPLGAYSAHEFLQNYWQSKPLLIRQAFGAAQPFVAPCQFDELLALALDPEAQARLIQSKRKASGRVSWQVEQSPLEDLPSRNTKGWTVLVQGVDRHHAGVRELLNAFRFIPDARLDDVMISYASDEGGIGAHLDSYDVFLLQGQGQRRWRLAAPKKQTRLLSGQPLKLLADFESEQEFVLEAGDMLYVPPGWAHEGTAIGECTTYSIGFRAPERAEVLRAWYEELADMIAQQQTSPEHYRDPASSVAPAEPAKIPAAMTQQMRDWINSPLYAPEEIEKEQAGFIGRYLSEPAPSVIFSAPRIAPNSARWVKQATQKGLRLALGSRMLFDQFGVYMNGESMECSDRERVFLELLANQRCLAPQECVLLQDEKMQALRELLLIWLEDGWLVLGLSDV
jgi:50S ribosomal protein L16 3-hydroxylase